MTARCHDFSTDTMDVSAQTPTAAPKTARSDRTLCRVTVSHANESISVIPEPSLLLSSPCLDAWLLS